MVILLEKKGFVFHIDPGPSPVGRLRRAGTLAAADVCIVCNREFLPHFPAQGKRLFGRRGRRMRRAEKEREGGGERRAGQSGEAAPDVAGKTGARWPMRRPKKWKSRARGNWCGQVLQGLIRPWKRRAGRGNRSSAQGFACRPEEKVMRTGTGKGRACLKRRMERDPCGGGGETAHRKSGSRACEALGNATRRKNRAGPGHQPMRSRLHLRHILFALRPCGAGAGQRARLPSPFDF